MREEHGHTEAGECGVRAIGEGGAGGGGQARAASAAQRVPDDERRRPSRCDREDGSEGEIGDETGRNQFERQKAKGKMQKAEGRKPSALPAYCFGFDP